MINKEAWQRFEREQCAREHLSIEQKYGIINALYDEARLLGCLPLTTPLEGIEIVVKIAKVINNVRKAA